MKLFRAVACIGVCKPSLRVVAGAALPTGRVTLQTFRELRPFIQ